MGPKKGSKKGDDGDALTRIAIVGAEKYVLLPLRSAVVVGMSELGMRKVRTSGGRSGREEKAVMMIIRVCCIGRSGRRSPSSCWPCLSGTRQLFYDGRERGEREPARRAHSRTHRHLTSPHLTHLTSPHPTSPHLTPPT